MLTNFNVMGGKKKSQDSIGDEKRIYRKKKKHELDDRIIDQFEENELKKETELLNLIAEIIVNATLRELYETGN